jgi:hypothetical protein
MAIKGYFSISLRIVSISSSRLLAQTSMIFIFSRSVSSDKLFPTALSVVIFMGAIRGSFDILSLYLSFILFEQGNVCTMFCEFDNTPFALWRLFTHIHKRLSIRSVLTTRPTVSLLVVMLLIRC